jgi:phosphoglycerate dehydrogenase-like enzyme
MRVHAINRRGASDAPTDWIGTPADLPALLAAADVLVLAAPLTRATEGMIGAAELAAMKPDAILINLARGELVDEAALFAHLQANPAFTACIDAWWIEPVRHGRFAMDHPFMTLPNVIASPHNSASVPETRRTACAWPSPTPAARSTAPGAQPGDPGRPLLLDPARRAPRPGICA